MILFTVLNLDREAWLLAVAGVLVVVELTVLFVATPADPDIYGHLTFGNEILKRGTLLQQDIYSYTAGSTYWINHEWLSETLFAGVWQTAGFMGLHWLKVVFLGLYLFCFFVVLKQLNANLRWLEYLFLCALLGLALYPYLLVRPQLVTYLMTQLLLIILLQFIRDPGRSIYLLPLIFVVWTNAHGGFIAGLGLLSVVVVLSPVLFPDRLPDLCLSGLLCLVGTLINPYGYYIYHQLFRTFSNPYTDRLIQDWQSVLSPGIITHPVVLSVTIVFLAYVYFFYKRTKTSRRWLLFALTVVCFVVGLMDVRNMVFVALIGLPALAELTPTLRIATSEIERPGAIVVILVLCTGLALGGHFKPNPDGYFPEETVRQIQSRGLTGNLAVPFNWGQYCIFHLHPAVKVSLDGRYDTVYPLSVFEDFELRAYQGKQWRKVFARYGTDFVLVPRDYPLHETIGQAPETRRLYSGPKASLYTFSTGEE